MNCLTISKYYILIVLKNLILQGLKSVIFWVKIPWVTRCEYNSDVGLALQLNDLLKPLLLNLQEHYTQYTLDEVLVMKSVYAIRLYELLQSRIMTRVLPKSGTDIELSIDTIKECCGCEGKSYNTFSNFKIRVIDAGVKEINEKTVYTLSYDYIKSGKAVTGLIFHINTKYH